MRAITLTWTSTFKPQEVTKAATRALKKAGGEALRAMRAEASRQVRSKKRFKVSAINRAMKLSYPRGNDINDLVWTMDVSGDPVPVSAFTVRQTQAGVTALINVGKASKYKGAFLATMRSGHVGVFYRSGEFGRRGNPKLEKIEEKFTTRITDVFHNEGMIPAVQEKTGVKFRTAFERLLGVELAK